MFMIVMGPKRGAAIVTGAASGLGQSLCRILEGAGVRVGGIDRSACPELAHSAVADVTDAAAMQDAVDGLAAELGGLDALAACAGVFANPVLPTHAFALDDWQTTLAVNAGGAFHAARAVIPHLLERDGGAIVLTASVAGHHPQPGGAAYSASKAAVSALARVIALEYAGHRIRCNSVLPGYMRTPMTEAVLSRRYLRERIEANIPMARIADPDEVAAVIAFLLSDAASYLTGQEVVVDGGSTLGSFVDSTDVPRMWRRFDSRESR